MAFQGKEIRYNTAQLECGLSELVDSGVTRLFVNDSLLTGTKKKFLSFLNLALCDAPNIFYVFHLEEFQVIDKEICALLSKLSCSVQIALDFSTDRKLFSRRVELLNRCSLVFGIEMEVVAQKNDTIKLFRERLDFVVSCYPNHIDFPGLDFSNPSLPTACYSGKDIDIASECAFACSVFYSAGRAVPWFLSVLKPLRIPPSKFFSDFSEWLLCNNCSLSTGFDPFSVPHEEIEKMQLLFLQIKYEEKNMLHVFPVARELVRLHGAFSRLVGEGQECVLELEFNPDDLCSPYAQDVEIFCENVCLEHCSVKIFLSHDNDGLEFPDYRIIK